MNWDLEDNFLESLMNMENDPASFEFFTNTDELISSTATTPRSYDTAESTSCSDSGMPLKSHLDYLRVRPRSILFTHRVFAFNLSRSYTYHMFLADNSIPYV